MAERGSQGEPPFPDEALALCNNTKRRGYGLSMRILYADAGLRGLEGHLASSGTAIPPAFRRLGHEVIVLGHGDLMPSLQQATGALPFFRAFTWGRWSPDPLAGWMVDFSEALSLTVADLHRAWSDFGPFDLVYVNTARAAQLAAAALWVKEAFPDRGATPAVAVQLGPDTGLSRSGPPHAPAFALRDPSTVMHRYAALLAGKEWVARLTLLAVNKVVAEEYSFLVDQLVKATTTPEDLPKPRQRDGGKELVIGVLGHQRLDKGYELLPDAISEVLQKYAHVQFLVQHSDPRGNAQDDQPRMERTTAKLSQLAAREPRLKMILQPVVGDSWFELIHRCDIVALPYDPPRYASSYSAIFGEALASGAAIVAPSGTTMSKDMDDLGGVGATFSEWTAPCVARAVGEVIDRFDDFRKGAFEGGVAWRRSHGPDAYVSAVIEAAGLDGAVKTPRPIAPSAKHAGTRRSLPATFITHPRLLNRASVKLPQHGMARPSFARLASWAGKTGRILRYGRVASILNTAIETSAVPWSYALTFDICVDMLKALPLNTVVTIEINMEVEAGAIGVAWIDKDYDLVAVERTVWAMPGAQRVLVMLPSSRACYLALRNVMREGDKSLFIVRGLKATATLP